MKYLHVVAGQVLGWWSSNLGVCVERGGGRMLFAPFIYHSTYIRVVTIIIGKHVLYNIQLYTSFMCFI